MYLFWRVRLDISVIFVWVLMFWNLLRVVRTVPMCGLFAGVVACDWMCFD